MTDFIDDGYTQEGYIASVEGVHGSLSFTYRPLIVEQRDAIDDVTIRQGGAKGSRACAAALAQQVSKWDLCKGNAEPVQIESANLTKVRPALFDKLYAIVAGRRPSDPRPTSTKSEDKDYITTLLNGVAMPEDGAKNS